MPAAQQKNTPDMVSYHAGVLLLSVIGNLAGFQLKLQFVGDQGEEFRIGGITPNKELSRHNARYSHPLDNRRHLRQWCWKEWSRPFRDRLRGSLVPHIP